MTQAFGEWWAGAARRCLQDTLAAIESGERSALADAEASIRELLDAGSEADASHAGTVPAGAADEAMHIVDLDIEGGGQIRIVADADAWSAFTADADMALSGFGLERPAELAARTARRAREGGEDTQPETVHLDVTDDEGKTHRIITDAATWSAFAADVAAAAHGARERTDDQPDRRRIEHETQRERDAALADAVIVRKHVAALRAAARRYLNSSLRPDAQQSAARDELRAAVAASAPRVEPALASALLADVARTARAAMGAALNAKSAGVAETDIEAVLDRLNAEYAETLRAQRGEDAP